jgi:hypothetical protein
MAIRLTTTQIDAALPKIEVGLTQYLWLQSQVATHSRFSEDVEFRKRFNRFYRVRRAAVWQNSFYRLMARTNREQLHFQAVLDLLREATGRLEASFTSKLIATLQPSKPVIDSVVMRNLGLRLPVPTTSDRVAKICELHQRLELMFAAYLRTDEGIYLVKAFTRMYPNAKITDEKKLDLVLWQTRG